jgi:hypothetical protein
MNLSRVNGTNTRSEVTVKQELITTTRNQTSMRMKMNLKKTGRSKLNNLTVSDGDVERRIRARRI